MQLRYVPAAIDTALGSRQLHACFLSPWCIRAGLYACQVDVSAPKEAAEVKAQWGIDLPVAGSDGSCDLKVGSPLLGYGICW